MEQKEMSQGEYIISELSKELALLKQELYATRYVVARQESELKVLKEKVLKEDVTQLNK